MENTRLNREKMKTVTQKHMKPNENQNTQQNKTNENSIKMFSMMSI